MVEIGNVEVSAFNSRSDCAKEIVELISEGSGGTIVAVNSEKVVAARKSERLKRYLTAARLRYPDGVGVVLAMRLKRTPTVRVAGADLWLDLVHQCPPGSRIAVIGARPDVLRKAVEQLQAQFPHVNIVLSRDGYDGIRNMEELTRELIQSRPEVVFLALGSPIQEEVMTDLGGHLPNAIFMGLGGSLDVYTGTKKRAPVWMQEHGLEWFYRLVSEPSRVMRQRSLVVFIWLLLTGRL
jgi:UDP-N-acetyl-D-mannosaminouronate:lipid I N-acetyl-D-mannosaminouronosyltransferase